MSLFEYLDYRLKHHGHRLKEIPEAMPEDLKIAYMAPCVNLPEGIFQSSHVSVWHARNQTYEDGRLLNTGSDLNTLVVRPEVRISAT